MAVTLTQIQHLLRKQRNLKMLGATLLLIVSFIYYFIREPCYDGKSVSEWVEEGRINCAFLESLNEYSSLKEIENYLTQGKAYLAIKAIGSSATPYLKSILKKKSMEISSPFYFNIYWSKSLPQFLKKMLPVPRIHWTTTRIKLFAACTLICMKMSSNEKNNTLFQTLINSYDFDLRSIAFILPRREKLTRDQISYLIDQLYSKYRDYRDIFYISDELDFKGTNLLKYYISFLTNEDAVLRQRTISACIKLEAIAKPALKNLMIIATNDSDRGIRLAAVCAIGSMGPSANEAIPLLSSLTNSEEKQISLKALHAISPQHR